MTSSKQFEPRGAFDARYIAFLETLTQLRPRLHRYCARMTGSVLDGEDMVQDALFEAYRKLDQFDDSRPLSPWLFRIAHNRCIDFLRRRKTRTEVEAGSAAPDLVMPADPADQAVGRAFEHLVLALPPKERACLLLKDVFEYSLEEISDLVGSTVGAVKAALSRGRSKLAVLSDASPKPRPASHETRQLLGLYVERFNRHDWDGVRELIRADAQLLVADRFFGEFDQSPYFGNYERWTEPWRLAVGRVDDQPAVLTLKAEGDSWVKLSAVRLRISQEKIAQIVDYGHCPWLLGNAKSIAMDSILINQVV